MNSSLETLNQAISNLADPQRRSTFTQALDLFPKIVFPGAIVETGCYRGHSHTDGNSTAIFATLARFASVDFISIDINPQHIAIAKDMLIEQHLLDTNISLETADSVDFLSNFTDTISLLYLDSLDYNPAEYLKSQIHQLAELAVAFNKLTSKAVVLLDDCHLPDGGKGALATSFLLSRGFSLVQSSYQSLFYRG